ncbi:MAG TPA: hypothetical protein VM532_12750 [Burkholderiales bacterium]|nr:hypothetical protein [Burkholderiales bacterium]
MSKVTVEHMQEAINRQDLIDEAIRLCGGHNPILAMAGALYLIERQSHENVVHKQDALHWKSNHDNQVKRAALLSQRADLPVDRVPAYREMEHLQQRLAEASALIRKQGRELGEQDVLLDELIPVGHQYLFKDPITGTDIWRSESKYWNGQHPQRSRPLYTREQIEKLPPQPSYVPISALIKSPKHRFIEAQVAICDKASEGPWFDVAITDDGLTLIDDGRLNGMQAIPAEAHDAAFIVAARRHYRNVLLALGLSIDAMNESTAFHFSPRVEKKIADALAFFNEIL